MASSRLLSKNWHWQWYPKQTRCFFANRQLLISWLFRCATHDISARAVLLYDPTYPLLFRMLFTCCFVNSIMEQKASLLTCTLFCGMSLRKQIDIAKAFSRTKWQRPIRPKLHNSYILLKTKAKRGELCTLFLEDFPVNSVTTNGKPLVLKREEMNVKRLETELGLCGRHFFEKLFSYVLFQMTAWSIWRASFTTCTSSWRRQRITTTRTTTAGSFTFTMPMRFPFWVWPPMGPRSILDRVAISGWTWKR